MEQDWDGKVFEVEALVRETGEFIPLGAIFYKGAWWLVLSYILNDSTQHKVPTKIIRLAQFRHEDHSDPRFRFFVNTPIPTPVLDGDSHSEYVVEAFPSILYTLGPKSTH
ncbi:MAG: hypothetical protein Q8L60_10825 [Gammaproteobacteria bacterium]|nr:hypothetical protein [Gammaproteobacteria bacterium]MDP2346841.1 hypothetical protein [Gammaproteobacteria bacterium]